MLGTTQSIHVNHEALQAFVVFADCLNFSQAALRLHISQPALHVKVRKLSEQLDRVLYRRAGRRLELTEHGRQVARFARETGERTAQFVQRLHGGDAGQAVSLAAGAGAFLHLLGEGMRKFIREGQGARAGARHFAPPRLLTLDRDAAVAAVRAGQAHLGVAPLEGTPPEFESRRLAVVGQVLVMPTGHPLAARRQIRLSDLAQARLIVAPEGRPHRQMLALLLQSAQVPWEVAVEVSGWDMMLHFVRLGLGLAVVNSYCQPPKGVVARPVPELPGLEFHLFHLREPGAAGEVARFKECLLEQRDSWKAVLK
jgi:DNA-binding transcriptional LysR family regulator